MIKNITELFSFRVWLRDVRRLSESSIYVYFHTLKLFFIEAENLNDIESYNIFLAKYTHKKRSTHYYSVLKAYIEYKFQNNPKVKDEFLKVLLKPKRYKDIKMERKYLPDEKLMEIINHMDDRHRLIAFIQILTALRAGDVLSLRREYISHEMYDGKPTLRLSTIGKGDKRTIVYLFDPTAIALVIKYVEKYDEIIKAPHNFYKDYIFLTYDFEREYENDEQTLFFMKKNNYLIYLIDLRKAIDASGIVNKKFFSTHDFRRCFARNVWETYKDVDLLQRALNHEDASTTLRYLRQSGLRNIDIFKQMQS